MRIRSPADDGNTRYAEEDFSAAIVRQDNRIHGGGYHRVDWVGHTEVFGLQMMKSIVEK